jgi:hypothetical protein
MTRNRHVLREHRSKGAEDFYQTGRDRRTLISLLPKKASNSLRNACPIRPPPRSADHRELLARIPDSPSNFGELPYFFFFLFLFLESSLDLCIGVENEEPFF